MRRLGYEALGFAVWHGGRWYLRRRLRARVRRTGRRLVVTAAVGGAATVVVRAVRR